MKLEDISEGMYMQIYTDGNIYHIYSSYGKLCIDFRGEERTVESFGNLIYRIYTFEELESIGKKILKDSDD